MQVRVTRNGVIMVFGIFAALVAVRVVVMRSGDAAAGSGQGSKADPNAVSGHVLENTPGFWTQEKLDEAEPMPLLPPPAHETGPAADNTPPAGRTFVANPRAPRGTRH